MYFTFLVLLAISAVIYTMAVHGVQRGSRRSRTPLVEVEVFRGPQMGGRGRIWHFWGAPIFSPEVPNHLFFRVLGHLDGKSGRPKNAKFNHDESEPPFAALCLASVPDLTAPNFGLIAFFSCDL